MTNFFFKQGFSIYLGYAGSLLLCGLFSSCGERGHSVCRLLSAVTSVVEHGL